MRERTRTASSAEPSSHLVARIFRMPGRGSAVDFPGQVARPAQFGAQLIDCEAHHPNRFMEAMAGLVANALKRRLFPRQLLLQKILSPAQLLLENPRSSLPRQSKPGEKRRPVALRSPLLALQSIRQRSAPARGCREDAPLWSRHRRIVVSRTNQADLRQLFERVVHLGTGNSCPIPYLPPLQFQVGLVAVHRTLRQKAEQHQVGCGQGPLLNGAHRAPSAGDSNTTTGIAQEAGVGSWPGPPPPETRRGSKYPASDQ